MTVRTRAYGTTAAMSILAVIATLFFLREARTLVIPIALAALISYALGPVIAWLERHRVPRMAGTALALLIVVGILAGGAYTLRDDAMRLVEALPEAQERAREMVLAQFGSGADAIQEATKTLGTTSVGTSGEAAAPTSPLQRGVSAIFSFAGHTVVIFFLVFFLLVSGHHVRNRIVEISGPDPERRRTTATIIDDINAQIQRYLLVLLVTAVIVGAATWTVLAWIGVQHAAMWGILAGVFNSIPYFGPVIVTGGLFVVGVIESGAAEGGGIREALQMSGAALLITSLEGWLLTPALMGKAERMSALAVFLGLLLWTWVWGAWGTVLAVPMLVIIKSFADHVERFKPVGRLMAP